MAKNLAASRLAVHFSSKTDDWATPQDLFDKLNAEHGPFELDVCANWENKKVAFYFGQGPHPQMFRDGLEIPWHMNAKKAWMNPPYGREIGKWVKKAYEESLKGCMVVALLPARTDTRWFHDFIYNKASVSVVYLRGRVKFGDSKNSAPFPSMVVIFRPQSSTEGARLGSRTGGEG
jgi:phage N-6-adenine-methyltransferase